MTKYILTFLVLCLIFYFVAQKYLFNKQFVTVTDPVTKIESSSPTPTLSPTPEVELLAPPLSKVLPTDYHVFQSFNNCGPAALSMTLSHYGINVSQQELGNELRPWQNPQGINDDKSTTLEELGEKAKDFNLIPYHRPNGNIDLITKFITYDIPVLTRTWTKVNEDIGHYRVVKGYNAETGQLIQDDSLQNKNLWYTYEDFNAIWQKFNYEYLVLIPPEKQIIAEAILGDEKDAKVSWQKAVKNAEIQLTQNPNDIYTRFNLSVALYEVGDYQRSVEEFEKVENQLPFRTLWYQIEPILAYYELGNYDKVIQISDRILNNQNRSFSELYYLKGQIYLKQGNKEAAQKELEKALLYKYNFTPAQELLREI